MTKPAAMFIRAAADALADDPDIAVTQLRELETADVDPEQLPGTGAFQRGYLLGLETARTLLAGGIRDL